MMPAAALLTIAATIPTGDVWADQFNDGNRWPRCTITYSTNHSDKALTRAVRDIRRTTGIRLRKVGGAAGAVWVWHVHDPSPDGYAATAEPQANRHGRYVVGDVIVYHFDAYPPRLRRVLYQHELGHILGLGHSAAAGEVMRPALPWDQPRTTPGYVAGLRALYPECR